jgi:hypothetical protein
MDLKHLRFKDGRRYRKVVPVSTRNTPGQRKYPWLLGPGQRKYP